MREEYNFEATDLLEGIGISMEEYHSCAKIMDKTMHDAQNFFEFTKGIENLIKSGDNPVLMRFIAMLAAQKAREIHSIDREKDLDASISANRIKDIAKTLGNLVKSEHETDDFDENIIKKG